MNPSGKYQVHFTYLLQPYIKNYGIFIAPADSSPQTEPSLNPCPNGTADFGKLDGWLATDVLRLAVSEQLHPGLQRHAGPRLAAGSVHHVPEPDGQRFMMDDRA